MRGCDGCHMPAETVIIISRTEALCPVCYRFGVGHMAPSDARSCEPLRWLPQRWTACGEKLPVMSVQRMNSMQHERVSHMLGSWVVRRYDHGTCKPCVGPVCEVGV